MAKMVKDFSVLILAIFLATMVDTVILDFQNPLHLANYLAAIYCGVQLVSILENESTCNGAPWARVMQKIVADKTERHFNVKLKDLMKEEEDSEKEEVKDKDKADTDNAAKPDNGADEDEWIPSKSGGDDYDI
jgi:hypothetical protein